MTKLNRDKPFGTIYGVHELNACYTQDGKFFDKNGTEVTKAKPAPKRKSVKQKAPPKKKDMSAFAEKKQLEIDKGFDGEGG